MVYFRRRKTPYLVKDSDKLVSWCKCRRGPMSAPYHDRQTFPTDGTGWLFPCMTCKRAFTFAKCVMIPETLEELARRETPRVLKLIDKDGAERDEVVIAGIDDWLALVRPLLETVEEGRRYVFFDGVVLPAEDCPVKFAGLWRNHDLPYLPHVRALTDPSAEEILHDLDYWSAADVKQPLHD